jgi:hypothetical protein
VIGVKSFTGSYGGAFLIAGTADIGLFVAISSV